MLIGHGSGTDKNIRLHMVQSLPPCQMEMIWYKRYIAVFECSTQRWGEEPSVDVECIYIFFFQKFPTGHGKAIGDGDILHSVCDGVDIIHNKLSFSRTKTCYYIHIGLDHS